MFSTILLKSYEFNKIPQLISVVTRIMYLSKFWLKLHLKIFLKKFVWYIVHIEYYTVHIVNLT